MNTSRMIFLMLFFDLFLAQSCCGDNHVQEEGRYLLEGRDYSDPLEDCGDFCVNNSESVLPVYAAEALVISSCKGLGNCLANVLLAVINLGRALDAPCVAASHPGHTVYSVFQPLGKIPLKPFYQVYRIGKRIYLLNCNNFAAHEMNKLSDANLEKNKAAEEYFKNACQLNDLLNYSVFRAYEQASLLEVDKRMPVRSEKSKKLQYYYNTMHEFFIESSTFNSDIGTLDVGNVREILYKKAREVGKKTSIARILFKRKSVKEEVKTALLHDLQRYLKDKNKPADTFFNSIGSNKPTTVKV